jgi:hypothetical protein
MDLPASGSAVDPLRFPQVVERILQKTPLTDLATLDRAAPAFAWTHESLALAATKAGRTMVLRALAHVDDRAVDHALGRAARRLVSAKAVRALLVVLDLLRDRALAAAALRLGGDGEPEPLSLSADQEDAAFAVGAGALVASNWLAQTGGGFSEQDRRALLAVLAPAAQSAGARQVKALLLG